MRYYGWLSPAAKAKLDRLRALLDWRAAEPVAAPVLPGYVCSCCGQEMILIGRFQRGLPS